MRFHNISIDTPNVRAHISFDQLSDRVERAQKWLDHQVFEDTIPYIPMDTGNMTETARQANVSREGSGRVVVGNTVYAWYQWNGKSRFTGRPLNYQRVHHPFAQSHWFVAAKAEHADQWRDGVRRIIHGG
ncbi:MAG: hypothetical protein IJM76_05945 [Lachnospiraceae bacterium]|nr:hypothetical protein [Lachnospiraceae bacterium]